MYKGISKILNLKPRNLVHKKSDYAMPVYFTLLVIVLIAKQLRTATTTSIKLIIVIEA